VLEEKIRAKYELAQKLDPVRAKGASPQVKVHVIGFAKLIGELLDGLLKVMAFFAVAASSPSPSSTRIRGACAAPRW
jgi:hypothetical protein